MITHVILQKHLAYTGPLTHCLLLRRDSGTRRAINPISGDVCELEGFSKRSTFHHALNKESEVSQSGGFFLVRRFCFRRGDREAMSFLEGSSLGDTTRRPEQNNANSIVPYLSVVVVRAEARFTTDFKL